VYAIPAYERVIKMRLNGFRGTVGLTNIIGISHILVFGLKIKLQTYYTNSDFASH